MGDRRPLSSALGISGTQPFCDELIRTATGIHVFAKVKPVGAGEVACPHFLFTPDDLELVAEPFPTPLVDAPDRARQRPALAAQAAPRRIHLCAGRMRSRSTSWRFSTASSGGFAVRRTPNAVRAAKRSSRANSQPARTAARTFPSSPRFADRSQQRPPLVAQAPPRRRRSGGSLDQLSAYRSGEETGARFEIQRLLRISPIATCSTQTVIPRRACQRRT